MNYHNTITFTAVGDMMLADEVIIRRNTPTITKNYVMRDPFKYTSELLRDSDITFGNLECPLCIHGLPNKDKDVVVRGGPKYAYDLANAGFNVVSIANNHIMDYGPEGLFETFNVLSRHKIKMVGAGKNAKAARKPTCLEVGGLKMFIMAYHGTTGTGKYFPGTAGGEFSVVKRDLVDIKGAADIIVISFHWGVEYLNTPPSIFIKFARQLIDAGAHIILGHHPHVLQGIERYRNGIIAYSLGNFVFDTSIHPVNISQTSESIILKCYLSRNGIQHYELMPVYINDRGQPEILIGKDKEKAFIIIEELNKNLNNPEMLKYADEKFINAGLNFIFKKGFLHFLKYSWEGLHKYPLVCISEIVKKILIKGFRAWGQI